MKGLVIIPSIRELQYWKDYENNAENNRFNLDDIEILIIDESPKNRKVNDKILENVNHSFYGFNERCKWLNERDIPIDTVPLRCHAETTFGLLYALDQKKYDYCIFIDDDTKPTQDDYFGGHINQLFENQIQRKKEVLNGKWYDFIQTISYYPRGFPYNQREISVYVDSGHIHTSTVMNQGLWCNQLDLNSTDILPHLNGLTTPVDYGQIIYDEHNFILAHSNYLTICSMNLSFKTEIIPAFYQLPMNDQGVDRFDDIWSGVILKKIADHLGDYISTGHPVCEHLKEPRSTFKDLVLEAKGLQINEDLWKIIDSIRLSGNTYRDCYTEIAHIIQSTGDYMEFLGKHMEQWIKVVDKLEE